MLRPLTLLVFFPFVVSSALAATVLVPQDQPTIQAAIDVAQPGDTVQVSPGRYRERIELRAGITVRSAGDNSAGMLGLERAAATTIDGGGSSGERPGVVMANGSTLDGFTITNVGLYDDAVWQQHADSQGEALGDDEGAVQAAGTIPAFNVPAVNCTVTNVIVHHNGDVGIAVTGSERRRMMPRIVANIAYRNMGGGIGIADLAAPLVRHNTCFENLRAGIGCRDGAAPIIRGNCCHKNAMAGIGCEGARPLIVDNVCEDNAMAGIGIRGKGIATIRGNTCRDNRLVAIGVIEGSSATISGNRLTRAGGMPPLIAVKDQSTALLDDNQIVGGGVAAILVQGTVNVTNNTLRGQGGKQSHAIWVWEGSTVRVDANSIDGYRSAIQASRSAVVFTSNMVRNFRGSAIVIKESSAPPHVVGNTAVIQEAQREASRVVEVAGMAGMVDQNLLVAEEARESEQAGTPPVADRQVAGGRHATQLRFVSQGAATVWDIQSMTGIGRTTVTRAGAQWPRPILVHLHLRGLESFKVTSGDLTVQWSVSSEPDWVTRMEMWRAGEQVAIPSNSPYRSQVRRVDAAGPRGYFEVPLPARLFAENPDAVTLEWIDFYRN